ncbi:MAG: hypothetical protein GY818_10900 [Planctomycetaceae bacterium]|nr:hypothetical protein [Planctomycetaceae bacterium]
MGSSKRNSGKPLGSETEVPKAIDAEGPPAKPVSAWLTAPQRGWFYFSSVLFLGWLCFLGVIAYMVNFQ